MAKSSKGSAFEREICKRLSLWWTDGEREDVFWRSAGSGAMAKTRSKMGKGAYGQHGDIQAVDPIGEPLTSKCSIELKRGYSKASVADVLDHPPTAAQSIWESFVSQAVTDASLAALPYWILITKRDKRVPLIFIPASLYRKLKSTHPDYREKGKINVFSYMWLPVRTDIKSKHRVQISVVCFKLEEFLDTFNQTHFQQL